MQLIDLGQHRELLKSWEEAHECVRRAKARGFVLVLMGQDGREVVHMGGEYLTNAAEAARAGLRLSLEVAHRTLTEAPDEAADRARLGRCRTGSRRA